MEKTIIVKKDYNTLDKLCIYLDNVSSFGCTKEYDIWGHAINENGQMEECLVLKKSAMHAVKVFFIDENTVKITYIIPNKIMNVYFGKSVKKYRNVLEIITSKIKDVVLAGPQQKAFNELEKEVRKAS